MYARVAYRMLFDEFGKTNVNLTQIPNAENFVNGFSLDLRMAFESMESYGM